MTAIQNAPPIVVLKLRAHYSHCQIMMYKATEYLTETLFFECIALCFIFCRAEGLFHTKCAIVHEGVKGTFVEQVVSRMGMKYL